MFLVDQLLHISFCIFFQNGSVQELIESGIRTQRPLPEDDILQMFKSLCQAVNSFHNLDPPLAHRDIKVRKLTSFLPVGDKSREGKAISKTDDLLGKFYGTKSYNEVHQCLSKTRRINGPSVRVD